VRVMEMTVEMLKNELLINGENWQASRSKAIVNESLAAKMTLEQQWALLTMLQQATMRLQWVYQQSRMRQGDVLPSDAERMERMAKAPKPTLPRGKVIVVDG
jgi:hypothetical protein